MDVRRAFIERDSLSENDLVRLRAALLDEVERYKHQIRKYPPDRMEKFGQPFLDRLTQTLDAVDDLIARKWPRS